MTVFLRMREDGVEERQKVGEQVSVKIFKHGCIYLPRKKRF